MAVYYNKEKSKIGTTTGTIINWSKQLTSNDPDDQSTKFDLPAGYLRCDGAIYAAEIYPELAEIVGVGTLCRYRKPEQTLLDNQFQLPDLGSKKIRASSGANLGDYIDLYIPDDNVPPDTIKKSGVGLDVQSNIGTSYEILYQGNFFLPAQQIEVTGQPGFTRTTGNYTESIDVLQNAMMPHGHFHDGTRTRIASSTGNEFSIFGRNSYIRKSTLCVVDWANNTRQNLCQLVATKYRLSGVTQVESNWTSCTRTYYGGCFSGCDFISTNNCLIPQGYTCAFPVWSGQCSGSDMNNASQEVSTCGTITYEGTTAVNIRSSGWPGCSVGGFWCDAKRSLDGNTYGPMVNGVLPANYTEENLPFDAFADSTDDTYYAAINNVTNQTEPSGNDGTHRHFVNFSATNHTYVVNTNPTFIPAIDIKSTITIQVNTENKADQFVQPYIVQEFLIKY